MKSTLGIPAGEIMSFISEESSHTASNTREARTMMRTGIIPANIKVLLWTSASIVGADIRCADADTQIKVLFHSRYDAKPESIAQMAGRFRDMSEIECIIGCSDTWYKMHFVSAKGYDHKIAMYRLIKTLEEGIAYREHYGTYKGCNSESLFFEDDINLLGVIEWITQQIRSYSDWNTLYKNFNISVAQVVKIKKKTEGDTRASFVSLENTILKMSDNIDFDSIEVALATEDVSELVKLPLPIQDLITACGNVNVKAGKKLSLLAKAKRVFTNPYRYRKSHKNKKQYPPLESMLKKPSEQLLRWNKGKALRNKCLTVLGHKEWYPKASIVKAIKEMRVGMGRPFKTIKEKNELLKKLNADRARVETILKEFVNVDVRMIGDNDVRTYRLHHGLPLSYEAEEYTYNFMEEEYEPFYKHKAGEIAQFEVIMAVFDDLDCT